MSDCDNCIYLDQDDNGEYCHKGHTGHKTLIRNCCDFEHWNTLTDEEKRRDNAETKMQLLWEYPNHKRGLGIPTLHNQA